MEAMRYRPKAYSFWFHYNKPASMARGKPVVTLHYRGRCHLVNDLTISVPTETRARKRQPRLVVGGRAACVEIHRRVDGHMSAIIQ